MNDKNSINNGYLNYTLSKDEKIAFINSFCMGDNLIGLVTAYNLYKNGFNVEIFGNFSYELRQWFPWATIFPSISPENAEMQLKKYSTIIYMYENEFKSIKPPHDKFIILSRSPIYKQPISMVDIQFLTCKKMLQLQDVVRTNGLVPLPNLTSRKNKQRIIIHPTSSLIRKNWPKLKFLKLAKLLIDDGYEPNFILSPKERLEWQDAIQQGYKIPEFCSLSDVASFIYESGYFIGNDSGIGHLASNLGIPTVTIVLRKGVARQWRPSWTLGEIILSPFWLNPRPLKEKFWKHFISVGKVLKTFKRLVKKDTTVL